MIIKPTHLVTPETEREQHILLDVVGSYWPQWGGIQGLRIPEGAFVPCGLFSVSSEQLKKVEEEIDKTDEQRQQEFMQMMRELRAK